jgi:hypothetical protein
MTGSTPKIVQTALCQAKVKQSESFKYRKRKTIDAMARSSPPIRGVGFEQGTAQVLKERTPQIWLGIGTGRGSEESLNRTE